MSYSNPQRVVNRIFEAFANGVQQNNRMQQASANNLSRAIAAKRKQTQLIMNQVETAKLNYAYKLDNIDVSANNTSFSDNMKLFFNDQVEKYYQVKNAIATGQMDKRKGQMVLGQMEQQVQKFQNYIPEILSLANTIYEQGGKAGKPGGISMTSPTNVLDIFGAIGTGEGPGVYMIEEPRSGDLFFMKMPKEIEEKFKEDDGIVDEYELGNFLKSAQAKGEDLDMTKDGAILNIDQMMKMGPKSLLKYVPDMSETFKGTTDFIFKPNKVDSDFFTNTTDYTLRPDENKYEITTKRTVTPAQVANMKKVLEDQEAFQTVLYDDEAMNSYWQDIMGQDSDYVVEDNMDLVNESTNKNRALAREFMINQSIADMLLEQGLIKGRINEDGERVAGPIIRDGKVIWNPEYTTADEAKVINTSMSEIDKITPEAERTYLNAMPDSEKDGVKIKGIDSIYKDIEKANELDDEETRNKTIFKLLIDNKVIDPSNSTYKDGQFKTGKEVLNIFKDGELNEDEVLFILAKSRMGNKTSINFPAFYKRNRNRQKEAANTSGLPGGQ